MSREWTEQLYRGTVALALADMFCRVCGDREPEHSPRYRARWSTCWGERVCWPCYKWWRRIHLDHRARCFRVVGWEEFK